jgi:predicted small metal-binding protein
VLQFFINSNPANFTFYNERSINMERYYIDCREQPSESKCTVALSADTKDELLDAAVHHATKVHGHDDTPEFREMILSGIKEGVPSA